MSSTFLGLEVARSGLNISQRSMDIVGKNIANANTKGYTRQRIQTVPAANDLGVQFVAVERVRDQFLDNQYRTEVSSLGEWEIKSTALTDLEGIMQEPSNDGISKALGDFFTAVQKTALQPEASDMRIQMRQSALKLTDGINYVYNKMVSMQNDYNTQVQTSVDQINNYANNINELNKQIQKIQINGESANEIKDQRDQMISELSKVVKISTSEDSNGVSSVMIGSNYLVNNGKVNLLDKPVVTDGKISEIKWADSSEYSGATANIEGGSIKGYMDIINGNGKTASDNPKALGIPYFINQLNTLAKSIATAVNDVHSSGYTIPNESNGNTSITGIPFFETSDGSSEITAENITVSSYITANAFNIAASSVSVNDYNKGNNTKINEFSALKDSNTIPTIGSFDGYIKEIVSQMAVESSYNQQMLSGQESITLSIENKISSTSGVSIDEEMTNMIKFQHSYSAAAKVISAIDQMLDTLINKI